MFASAIFYSLTSERTTSGKYLSYINIYIYGMLVCEYLKSLLTLGHL